MIDFVADYDIGGDIACTQQSKGHTLTVALNNGTGISLMTFSDGSTTSDNGEITGGTLAADDVVGKPTMIGDSDLLVPWVDVSTGDLKATIFFMEISGGSRSYGDPITITLDSTQNHVPLGDNETALTAAYRDTDGVPVIEVSTVHESGSDQHSAVVTSKKTGNWVAGPSGGSCYSNDDLTPSATEGDGGFSATTYELTGETSSDEKDVTFICENSVDNDFITYHHGPLLGGDVDFSGVTLSRDTDKWLVTGEPTGSVSKGYAVKYKFSGANYDVTVCTGATTLLEVASDCPNGVTFPVATLIACYNNAEDGTCQTQTATWPGGVGDMELLCKYITGSYDEVVCWPMFGSGGEGSPGSLPEMPVQFVVVAVTVILAALLIGRYSLRAKK